MVKLTYGGNLSVDSADDSGNIADESEVGELETRWDALMTSYTVGLFLKVLTGLQIASLFNTYLNLLA